MEEKEQDGVLAFDALFTTNELQMLKILLPHTAPSMQKFLAVYIKFRELLYTASYFRYHRMRPLTEEGTEAFFSPRILHALYPYCTEEQAKTFKQLEQMTQMMKNYKEITETMEMLKDILPEGMSFPGMEAGADPSGGFSPDMLLAFLSPEQQELFELLKGGPGNDRTEMDAGRDPAGN